MLYLSRSILLLICLIILFLSFVGAQEKQSNDLFVVIVNDKRGYIDRTGKVVIEPQWSGARNFSEGLAVVAENGYEGYINEAGKVVIPIKFDRASSFSEGLAAVGFDEYDLHNRGEHKTGFIDKTGKIVIEPKFRDAEDFSEGLAVVHNEGKSGFIDKNGKIVIPLKFDYAFSFSEGLAVVFSDNKYGYINKKGDFVIKPQFSSACSFSEELACVVIGGTTINPYPRIATRIESKGQSAYINKEGKIVLKLKAEEARSFSEGLAAVKVKGKNDYTYIGFIDKSGRFIIEPKFGTTDNFSDGLSLTILNTNLGFPKDGFGFIDKTGKIVMFFDYPSEYAMVRSFENGLAWVQQGGEDASENFREEKYGYIDKTGKVIWQPTK